MFGTVRRGEIWPKPDTPHPKTGHSPILANRKGVN
jgi:hypothetical protein